jgi:hypothetical protein
MKNEDGWKNGLKTEERIKWMKKRMNKLCSQPKVMCQSKFYLFTINKYMSIETPRVHI